MVISLTLRTSRVVGMLQTNTFSQPCHSIREAGSPGIYGLEIKNSDAKPGIVNRELKTINI